MSQLLHKTHTVLWMDWFRSDANFNADGVKHCCETLEKALTNVCEQHKDDSFQCHDMVVSFSPMFREYGLIIHDGAQSIKIQFCPFCGEKLPESLRDTWFDQLESLGVEDPFEDAASVPEKYKSATWWLEGNS